MRPLRLLVFPACCLTLLATSATAQTIVPIANIQDSIDVYDGRTVTVQGVSLGDNGDLWSGRTSVYIQDDSGHGIQVFDYNTLYPWNRGDLIKVTGEIEDYQGSNDNRTTEILPSSAPSIEATGQPLPTPATLTTAAANDAEHEGSYVQITGEVTDFIKGLGGGANIGVDDGSGEITVRVWDSIGIDLSAVDMSDSITVKGIVSPYTDDFQVLLVDDSDLWVGGEWVGKITPIASIQDSIDVYDGRNVTIEGVVTVGWGKVAEEISGSPATSIYVQDESGRGINIFEFGKAHEDLVRGTRVRITGEVVDYPPEEDDPTVQFRTTEVVISEVENLGVGAPLPADSLLTIAEANDPKWDGTLITVNGWVTETPSNAGGGWNIEISDGSGNTTVRVWDTAGLGAFIEENLSRDQLIEAKGVGSVYNDAFQILLNYQEDLSLAGTPPDGLDTLTVDHATLSVPRALFAPTAQEKVRLIWNAPPESHVWIQIFDMTGRSVATLLEEPNAPPYGDRDLYWDGRDRLNQRLTAGTYIVHIRASQTGDGSITAASAPIVIGARLD
ncbi:MAG: hypothetical protein CME06_07020 [Gemmatimonadetes bacterium]|nr:hypothetical protein [Gemmatimonadota bacterium]